MRSIAYGLILSAIVLMVFAVVFGGRDREARAEEGPSGPASEMLQDEGGSPAGHGEEVEPEPGILGGPEAVGDLGGPEAEPGETPDEPIWENLDWAAPDAARTIELETEVAGALVHRGPAELARLLAERGGELSDSRRNLVLAFSAALAGGREQAARAREGLQAGEDLAPAELRLLDVALGHPGAAPLPAAAGQASPIALAMSMRLAMRDGRRALKRGEYERAAGLLSQALLDELGAPWDSERATLAALSKDLGNAQEQHRWNREGNWPSIELEVEQGDSLVAIRKRVLESRPDLILCTGLIDRANGLRGRYLQPNQVLRVPTERSSMLVDLSSRWAVLRHGAEAVAAWEVGIGRSGEDTPVGEFTVGDKKEEPMWFRRGEAPVPYGDPGNPLGSRWLGWHDVHGPTSLGFHGTNEPDSIGNPVSEGCIRMRNGEVEVLFDILPIGASVTVRL